MGTEHFHITRMGSLAFLLHFSEAVITKNPFFIHRIAQQLRKSKPNLFLEVIEGITDIVICTKSSLDTATVLNFINQLHWEDEIIESNYLKVAVDFDQGIDLMEVINHLRLSREQFIETFCALEYTVTLKGFIAGFSYLKGLSPVFHMPRRNIPRKGIPKGSLAIGGEFAGIYGLESPGGWNIIGRCIDLSEMEFEDLSEDLKIGTRIKFYSL